MVGVLTCTLQLKRAHSADPESASASSRKSPSSGPFTGEATPPEGGASLPPLSGASLFSKSFESDAAVVGSPLKKARPSIAGLDDANGGGAASGAGLPQLGDVLAQAEAGRKDTAPEAGKAADQKGGTEVMEEEEEL